MDTRKLLEELENVIDSATEVPFSNKKMVDKDEIERLIDAINQSLPNEVPAVSSPIRKEFFWMQRKKRMTPLPRRKITSQGLPKRANW